MADGYDDVYVIGSSLAVGFGRAQDFLIRKLISLVANFSNFTNTCGQTNMEESFQEINYLNVKFLE